MDNFMTRFYTSCLMGTAGRQCLLCPNCQWGLGISIIGSSEKTNCFTQDKFLLLGLVRPCSPCQIPSKKTFTICHSLFLMCFSIVPPDFDSFGGICVGGQLVRRLRPHTLVPVCDLLTFSKTKCLTRRP